MKCAQIPFFLSTFLLFCTSQPTWAGGSFSGGENGVACFANEMEANAAVDKDGRIHPSFKPKIKSLYASEFWEGEAQENPCNLRMRFLRPRPKDSVDEFIERAFTLTYVKQDRHLLLDLFQRTSTDLVPFEQWSPETQVDPVQDHAVSVNSKSCLPKKANTTAHCRIVQIARWDKAGDGTFKVTFDKDLYVKLDQLNRALVRAHETLYIVASKMGHDRSEKIRAFVSFLFNEVDLQNFKNPNRALSQALVKEGLMLYPGLLESLPSSRKPTKLFYEYKEMLEEMELWGRPHGLSVSDVFGKYALTFLMTLESKEKLTDEKALLWEVGRLGEHFDHLLDDSPVLINGKSVSVLSEVCWGPSLTFHGTFGLVLDKIREGHFRIAKSDQKAIEQYRSPPMKLPPPGTSTCAQIQKLQPQDDLAKEYLAMCIQRERANRYCVQKGFEWKPKK